MTQKRNVDENPKFYILIDFLIISLFTGNAPREQHEDTDALHRLPRCPEHRHVLRGIVIQHRRFLRLLEIRRGHESLDHIEPRAERYPCPIRQIDDRRGHLPHLRPPILRAHGDNLEKRETIFRFEETLSRIRDTYRDGDIHGDRGYCHTKLGSVHFLGRRRMPVHPWLDVPVGDRTGHRVGSGKRIGRLLLETVEELGYHLVRRAGLSDRYLREHPRDSRRE